uniref:Secreted protein n=1 Tax=Parascaris univalens TaxID=6257 RepID=A0A915B664_PARUN
VASSVAHLCFSLFGAFALCECAVSSSATSASQIHDVENGEYCFGHGSEHGDDSASPWTSAEDTQNSCRKRTPYFLLHMSVFFSSIQHLSFSNFRQENGLYVA